MSSNQSASVRELIPDSWFEPVVGLSVVLLVALGVQLTVWVSSRLLNPLGVAPWAAVVVTTFIAVIAYGVFGIGLVHIYRQYRNFEVRFVLQQPDRREWRWYTALAVFALVVPVLGGVWSNADIFTTSLLGIGSLPFPEGMSGLTLSLTGVNDMVNQAPLVAFGVLFGGLLMGPTVGALFHGVLQDTLVPAVPQAVALTGTAVITMIVAGPSSGFSVTTVLVFGFILGVAYAYQKTENLVMVMVAYGLFNAFALVLSWVNILANLHVHGHLLG